VQIVCSRFRFQTLPKPLTSSCRRPAAALPQSLPTLIQYTSKGLSAPSCRRAAALPQGLQLVHSKQLICNYLTF